MLLRNRIKIKAAVHNARTFLATQEEFGGFDAIAGGSLEGSPKLNRRKGMREIPATSLESDAIHVRSRT
jgi:DNA-3-methyladenine glycosylase I